jgi:polyhydroxyalkanoate synthesis repressor PhaR
MTRFVKRYTNRKLYDLRASRYVSLEDLAEAIRGGEVIVVTDAATGKDMTSVTLAQIILERERSSRGALSCELLHQLVRQPADGPAGDGDRRSDAKAAADARELERLGRLVTALEQRLQSVERRLQPPG